MKRHLAPHKRQDGQHSPAHASVPDRVLPARSTSRSGFSLVEVIVAAMIATVGLTAVYLTASRCLQSALASYHSSLANQFLQEQTERLKRAGFSTLLNSGSLGALLETSGQASAGLLGGLGAPRQTITITSYLASGSAAEPRAIMLKSSLSNSGNPSVESVSTGILEASTVQAQVTLDWTERNAPRSRTATTLITRYE